MEKKYFYNVDTLRIIFAIIIVYFHLCPKLAAIANNTSLSIYKNMVYLSKDAYLTVECFFIISGFFLYRTFVTKKNLSWYDFVKSKIARLWPVLAFSTIICVLFYKYNIYSAVINLLFMQCIGVSLMYKGINWYISALFWALVFYFYVLKSFSQKHANLIIVLCVYFSFTGLITYFHGSFNRETFNTFFSGGMLRALASIGVGYLVGIFYDRMKPSKIKNYPKLEKMPNLICISALEIICFIFLTYNFVFHRINYQNKFIFIVVFTMLFLLFLKKEGLLSSLLNSKYLALCGKYAYSIYAMQQVGFFILQSTLWKNSALVEDVPLCVIISILFVLAIGIGTYYLIELPCGKYLKNHFNV